MGEGSRQDAEARLNAGFAELAALAGRRSVARRRVGELLAEGTEPDELRAAVREDRALEEAIADRRAQLAGEAAAFAQQPRDERIQTPKP